MGYDGWAQGSDRAGPDEIVQSRFYNGWKSDHYATGVLGFVPDGTITIAFYNVPGCCHDSTDADWGDLYLKLEKVYKERGLKFVIDSAFSSMNHDFLIKSSQDDLTADAEFDNIEAPNCKHSCKEGGNKHLSICQVGYERGTDFFPQA